MPNDLENAEHPPQRNEPQWLTWAKALQAIAQTGLTYGTGPFNIERYEAVRHIAAEMMAAGSDNDVAEIQGLFQQQNGYATPKVDVRGAAIRDGKVLLVKEASDGLWTLPGGWADVNEAPSRCVVREVREESGFTVTATKLAAVYDRGCHAHEPPFAFHVYKMFFLCEITGGAPKTSLETLAVDFFAPDDLPALSSGRVLPFQIQRMFDHHETPGLPADFD